MTDTTAVTDDGWGPVLIASWRDTPCLRGRTATEADVRDWRAVFFVDAAAGNASQPFDLNLPHCAILHAEDGGDVPVIVIQVEIVENVLAGYRPLRGGNGICILDELDLLEEPDDRFREPAAEHS